MSSNKKTCILIICLLVILSLALTACDDGNVNQDSIALSIENAKTNFLIGEAFTLGNEAKIIKIINMNVSNTEAVSVDDVIIDSTLYNNTVSGTYAIVVKLREDEEIKYTYYVTVTNLNPVVNVLYTGGDIFEDTDISKIVLSLDEESTLGTVRLLDGQKLLVGTHEYDWVFVPDEIFYKTAAGKIELTVKAKETDLSELIITSPPSKLVYKAFEPFDKSGLVVSFMDSKGNLRIVTDYSLSESAKSLTTNITQLEVSYGGKTAAIDIIVNKLDSDYNGTPLTAVEGQYGMSLKDVILPNGFVWVSPEIIFDSVGEKQFEAVYYKNNDTLNYNGQKHSIKVDVKKASPVLEPIGVLDGYYGQVLSNTVLPENYYWKQPNILLTNGIGEFVFKAGFIPNDTDNFYTIDNIDITLMINKATVMYKSLPDFEIEYGEKLADNFLKLDIGFSWADENLIAENIGDWEVGVNYTYLYDTEHYNTVNAKAILKVVKATPADFIRPNDIHADYGTILNDISLPNNFEWKDGTKTVGNVRSDGEANEIAVFYKPEDSEHYKSAEFNLNVYVYPIDSIVTISRRYSGTIYDNDVFTDKNLELVYSTNQEDNYGTVSWKAGQKLIAGTNTFQWIFISGSNNYNDAAGFIELDVINLEIISLKVNNLPSKTAYNAFEVFAADGMEIKAVYNDGSEAEINNYQVAYENADNYFTAADSKITINFDRFYADINITVYKIDLIENKDYIVPLGIEYPYNSKLSDYDVFKDYPMFKWKDKELTVGEVGKKEFSAVITPDDLINYKTKTISVEITVTQIEPEVDVPQDLEAVYLDKLGSVNLKAVYNGVFEWENPETVINGVGKIGFAAIFKPNNGNYKSKNIIIIINVKKLASSAVIEYKGGIIYDNSDLYSLDLTVVSGNTEGSVEFEQGQSLISGTASYKWIFTPTDKPHYENCSGYVELTVTELKITEFRYLGQSEKLDYIARDAFVLDGLTFEAKYNNGFSEQVDNEKITLLYQHGDDMLHGGDTYINFVYKGSQLTYNLDVIDKIATTAEILPINDITADYGSLPKTSEILLTIENSTVDGVAVFDTPQLSFGKNEYLWHFVPDNTLDYEEYSDKVMINVYLTLDYNDVIVSNDSETAQYLGNREYKFTDNISYININSIAVVDNRGFGYIIKATDNSVITANQKSELTLELYYNNLKMSEIELSFIYFNENYEFIKIEYGILDGYQDGVLTFGSYIKNLYSNIKFAGEYFDLIKDGVIIDESYSLPSSGDTVCFEKIETINALNSELEIAYGINVYYIELPITEITVGETIFVTNGLLYEINYKSGGEVTVSYSGKGNLNVYDQNGKAYAFASGDSLDYGTYSFVAENNGLTQTITFNIDMSFVTDKNFALISYDNKTVYEDFGTRDTEYTVLTQNYFGDFYRIYIKENCEISLLEGSDGSIDYYDEAMVLTPTKSGDNLMQISVNDGMDNTVYYIKIQVQNIVSFTMEIGDIQRVFNFDVVENKVAGEDNDLNISDSCAYMTVPLSALNGNKLDIVFNSEIYGIKKDYEVMYGQFDISYITTTGNNGIQYVEIELICGKYNSLKFYIFIYDGEITKEQIESALY